MHLKKFLGDSRKDWPQWLLFLLFAICEVPQASTDFSPLELLYGRHPRGILDMLWEESEIASPAGGAPASYLLALCRTLQAMAQLAQAELALPQEAQRQQYDEAVHPRSFQPGQGVLLLFASFSNKLLLSWQEF